MNISELRTVDLFCGGGGLSQGLGQAGFKIVRGFDAWPAAVDFYNRNIKGHQAELLTLEATAPVIDRIGQFAPDVIVGGPPCQDFSSAGKRDENGGRANLTLQFAGIVQAIKPRFFIMENVDRAIKTNTYKQAVSMFREAGYGLSIVIYNAALCGVPQVRKRCIVVGFLNQDCDLIPFIKSRQAAKPMTIRECYGDSFGIEVYYRHPRSYARRGIFSIDEPSPTVRGVNRPMPSGYPGHPGDVAPISPAIRCLTTKERSLLQTFPASWDVSGPKADMEQIIGNAVPVKLAEFVGRCVRDFCEGKKVSEECRFNSKTDNALTFEGNLVLVQSVRKDEKEEED